MNGLTKRQLRRTLRTLYREYRWNIRNGFRMLADRDWANIQMIEQKLADADNAAAH